MTEEQRKEAEKVSERASKGGSSHRRITISLSLFTISTLVIVLSYPSIDLAGIGLVGILASIVLMIAG